MTPQIEDERLQKLLGIMFRPHLKISKYLQKYPEALLVSRKDYGIEFTVIGSAFSANGKEVLETINLEASLVKVIRKLRTDYDFLYDASRVEFTSVKKHFQHETVLAAFRVNYVGDRV